MSTPGWRARLVSFWPTLLMRRELVGHERESAGLLDVVHALDKEVDQLTTAYQGADFLSLDYPPVHWLRTGIDSSVQRYLDEQGLDYPIRWTLQAWANVNRYGDYHAPHNHGWCYLSGTYYVAMPDANTGNANAISFYDPRGSVNMVGSAGDLLQHAEQVLRPQPGTLLLWHSALQHLVHPNLSDVPRVTISFNVVLEWANHYVAQ